MSHRPSLTSFRCNESPYLSSLAATHSVVQSSHLGAQTSHLGAQSSHLGAQSSHLGAQSSHLGAQLSHLGAQSSHLGAQSSHLGAQSSHLGAQSSHLGTQLSHLGTQSRWFRPTANMRIPRKFSEANWASPDSDVDEVDETVRVSRVERHDSPASSLTAFFIAVWLVITTTWAMCEEATWALLGRQNTAAPYGYYTPTRRTDARRSHWTLGLDCVYVMCARLRLLDNWILAWMNPGTGTIDRTNRGSRMRLLVKLFLLQSLLFCGCWYYAHADKAPLTSVASSFLRSPISLGNLLLIPFARNQPENHVTAPTFEALTQHPDFHPTAPTFEPLTQHPDPDRPTPATVWAVDLDTLTTRVVNSRQMQLLLASHTKETHTKEVDIESFVSQIFNSDRLRELIASNCVDIDHKALARAIVEGDEMKSWLATIRKDVDIELLTVNVLGSPQMQRLLGNNRKEVDVELIASQVVASGLLREWLAAERKEAYVVGMAARDEREGEREWRRREDERWKLQLQAELEREDALLALLSDDLSRVTDRILSLDTRLSEAEKNVVGLLKVLRGLEEQLRLAGSEPVLPMVEVERHVTRFLAGVFGQSDGSKEVEEGELRARIASVFVARKESEDNLASGLSRDEVWAIVNEALSKYDPDKYGMVDYALESSGGQVISTRCSEAYIQPSATLTLFGIPLWYRSNSPRSIIQPGMRPGQCWAFRGSRGNAVIRLAGPVRISAFILEHIPETHAFPGSLDFAPKDFTVLGLTKLNDPEPILLGKYVYQRNGTSLQHFMVQRTDLPPFQLMELQIESNHGNMAYTCLYRFRVYGSWNPE